MEDIREGVCPLCRHNEILSAVPQGPPVPLFIALGYDNDSVRLEDIGRSAQQQSTPTGVLMVFTCRRCGFSQLFATLPEEIPLRDGGPSAHGAMLIKGREPAGPYR
jgi:hypothetical protein